VFHLRAATIQPLNFTTIPARFDNLPPMLSQTEIVRLIFGLKLRSLRQARGLSYQQLADVTGLAVSYLHDIENGKKYPKAIKTLALAKALGVDYDYLVSLSGDKKLQPLIELLNADFLNVVPWQHFGIPVTSLLGLFTNTPDKVTAFISTLIKIFRSYVMSKESFYTAALRSYQDLYNNYFEELEAAAVAFTNSAADSDFATDAGSLEALMLAQFGIRTDRKKLGGNPVLSGLRSYYSEKSKTLYLNKLAPAQEAFLIARELGFQQMRLAERPFETIMRKPVSFDVVLNNFKASYFAAALLIPEDALAEALSEIFRQSRWNGVAWLELISRLNATPEMFLQRLTNVLPRHFGIDQLFFLRMTYEAASGACELTKELHLAQLHNPHATVLNEHYCRRWVAVRSMSQVSALAATGKYKKPQIEVQISQYWQTHDRYLCISIAKPRQKGSTDSVSVTIGLAIDKQLAQTAPFVNDPAIPVVTVNTTCERCSITDCRERAAAPVVVEQALAAKRVDDALNGL
jgi:transcriptional regulator with XRE-family HTH domain